MAGTREAWLAIAAEAADVVEVPMRHDHHVDVLRSDARMPKLLLEPSTRPAERMLVGTDTGVDEHHLLFDPREQAVVRSR